MKADESNLQKMSFVQHARKNDLEALIPNHFVSRKIESDNSAEIITAKQRIADEAQRNGVVALRPIELTKMRQRDCTSGLLPPPLI